MVVSLPSFLIPFPKVGGEGGCFIHPIFNPFLTPSFTPFQKWVVLKSTGSLLQSSSDHYASYIGAVVAQGRVRGCGIGEGGKGREEEGKQSEGQKHAGDIVMLAKQSLGHMHTTEATGSSRFPVVGHERQEFGWDASSNLDPPNRTACTIP